jgi:hypothetical protein
MAGALELAGVSESQIRYILGLHFLSESEKKRERAVAAMKNLNTKDIGALATSAELDKAMKSFAQNHNNPALAKELADLAGEDWLGYKMDAQDARLGEKIAAAQKSISDGDEITLMDDLADLTTPATIAQAISRDVSYDGLPVFTSVWESIQVLNPFSFFKAHKYQSVAERISGRIGTIALAIIAWGVMGYIVAIQPEESSHMIAAVFGLVAGLITSAFAHFAVKTFHQSLSRKEYEDLTKIYYTPKDVVSQQQLAKELFPAAVSVGLGQLTEGEPLSESDLGIANRDCKLWSSRWIRPQVT